MQRAGEMQVCIDAEYSIIENAPEEGIAGLTNAATTSVRSQIRRYMCKLGLRPICSGIWNPTLQHSTLMHECSTPAGGCKCLLHGTVGESPFESSRSSSLQSVERKRSCT